RPEPINPVIRDYSDTNLPDAPAVRTYQAPGPPPLPDPRDVAAARAESERPTIFLIAFKDQRIVPALAFWVDQGSDTLNYVTRDQTINHVSLDLIDRDFSRQLNRERGLEFKVP